MVSITLRLLCSTTAVNQQSEAPGEGSPEFSNRSRVSKDFCDVVDLSLLPLLLLLLNDGRRRRCRWVCDLVVRGLIALSRNPDGDGPSACRLNTPVRMALVGETVRWAQA